MTQNTHTPLPPSFPSQPKVNTPLHSPTIKPLSVGTTKESGPTIIQKETPNERKSEVVQSMENETNQEKQPTVTHTHENPTIHPDAAAAGLQIAPSASPFPTVYDIKVPILKDEEIEKNLHKSFFTGARWLAEMCKYILWQAHIRIKKNGGKTVRERIVEKF